MADPAPAACAIGDTRTEGRVVQMRVVLPARLLGGHAVQTDNLVLQRRFARVDVTLALRRSRVRRGEAPLDSNRFGAIA